MPKGKALKNPNGYGSIVKLSGNRRKPYEVRVNTRIDDRGYPKYDVLGRFPERQEAMIALAKYNEDPYDIASRDLTFQDVFDLYYDRKYNKSAKKLSQSSKKATMNAYKKCNSLYNIKFKDIRTLHMQTILDTPEYSHATVEHIKNLFRQMYSYALEYDIVQKDWSAFAKINKEEDDESGVPFSTKEIQLLWKHKDKPWVDTILIYIYSGWRVTELLEMPLNNIDMQAKTFTGGKKTKRSKNRVVPIHSAIYPLVEKWHGTGKTALFSENGEDLTDYWTYRGHFTKALQAAGVDTTHTPHDCRHTFTSLLNNAGANDICIKRLLGHSTGDITIDVYTHKSIDVLRAELEKIKVP